MINIKLLSDIHYSLDFDDNRLLKIIKRIKKNNTDYICIAGDTLDRANELESDKIKKNTFINWLKSLADIAPVIITFGNHDITITTEKKRYYLDEQFWQEVNSLDNVHVLYYDKFYEDEKVYIASVELPYEYYINDENREDKKVLIKYLQESNYTTQEDKVNILLSHSPIYMNDKDIVPLISSFDLILSGHMHNGLVPPLLDKIKGNRGFVGPYYKLLPKNARGYKNIKYNKKNIKLCISGGITKLARPTSFRGKFAFLFPSSIYEIKIDDKKRSTFKELK